MKAEKLVMVLIIMICVLLGVLVVALLTSDNNYLFEKLKGETVIQSEKSSQLQDISSPSSCVDFGCPYNSIFIGSKSQENYYDRSCPQDPEISDIDRIFFDSAFAAVYRDYIKAIDCQTPNIHIHEDGTKHIHE